MVVGGRELIDTLWNVNDNKCGGTDVHDNRINRYIMECKSLYAPVLSWNFIRINRYIMECKSIIYDFVTFVNTLN